ncbi:hypothetical protein Rleg9DRAFT_3220 [Rhizobium leguminosarum bv. trifolii WSM597]|uniref:DUF4145 domain-containing protein n=1 Tax=Rhizobium leguminosarum bv. trifolii WSM597 TaxID=754764 RepID=I9NCC4_RHILT|nr:hypothetical protein [Rhizobium leguminosarum]EJB04367.1 hypothetical protein Rleg9DRAFT_3220 [Rhizobium leguminosarum bv. trifolii WSM597]
MTEEELAQEFNDIVTSGDPLTVVIRSTVVIEHELTLLIEERVHTPSALKSMDLTYNQTASLAVALGVHTRLLPPLNALGKIRNRFAHQLIKTFSKNDADNFYKSFAQEDKDIITRVFTMTRGQSTLFQGIPKSPAALEPIERFAVCVLSLRAAVIAAREMARRK